MSEPIETKDRPEREEARSQEPWDSEIRFGALLALGGGLLALVLFSAVGVYFLFKSFLGWQERQGSGTPVMERPETMISGPRLLPTPEKTLREFRSQAETALSSYGWIDEAEGIAHIPIERAIEIVGERGLPSRPELAPEDPTPETAPGGDATTGIEASPLAAEEEAAARTVDEEENR